MKRFAFTHAAGPAGILLALVLTATPPAKLHAQTQAPLGARSANLQQTLEKGLRARRPVEFAFLDRVVDMVEKNELPLDLVRSTFGWARHKRPYPYQYFERALKIRAARIGIIVK